MSTSSAGTSTDPGEPADVVPPTGSRVTRVLDLVERVGNALPHPFWLFWILSAVVAAVSAVLSGLGVSMLDPATGEVEAVRNALSVDAVRDLLGGAEEAFVTFGPLGTVLIVMLGVAVADRSGLFEALARRMLTNVSPRWVVLAVALAGALSKFLSDSAYVVLIPLAAIAFKSVGRSPMLGMIVAFVSINAAGDANPLIAPGDVVFASVATEAARVVDPEFIVRATDNMYFTTVSAVVLAVTVWLVTEKLLARRESHLVVDADIDGGAPGLTTTSEVDPARERPALRRTGLVALAFVALVVIAVLPTGSPLRGEDGGLLESTLLGSIALLLSAFFLTIGAAYARFTGRLTRSGDIPGFMADGVRSIAPLLVIFFAVSQFLALFRWTGISTVVAVSGADLLRTLDAPQLLLLVLVIAGVACLNLLITSGQALWALVAPVLVPMLMLIGTNPAATMAVYRIADSCTNSITPMSTSFVLTVGYLQMLNRRAGVGTLVSFTLPAALTMLVVWTLLFAAWWLLGIPLGPGAPVR